MFRKLFSVSYFVEYQHNSKVYIERQKTENRQNNIEGEKQNWETITTESQNLL